MSKFYKCIECGDSFISGDTDPEEKCKHCEQESMGELKKTIELQKSVIAHMSKRQHEADEVISFISQGCLVPPDGGSPDLMDAVKACREYQKKYTIQNIQQEKVE